MPTLISTTTPDPLLPAIYPELAKTEAGKFGASLTLAKGTVLGKKTSDSKLYAYNDANSDGTETAVGINEYPIKTDASGNVFLSDSIVASETNRSTPDSTYFFSGIFKPADLTGEDAAALVDLHARTLPSGNIYIP